jgi:ATP-dependent DNA ligase
MEINKTIYKKDTKGKTRYLKVTTFEGILVQNSGVMETDNPVVHEKFCEGKNLGKSNETTAKQQAVKQAEALIVDKLTHGYFETIEETETEEVILPMLAKDYKKESKKINWEEDFVYVQPKFDGMRCLAFLYRDGRIVLMSRAGKEIEGLEHIRKDLATITNFEDEDRIILDGELYVYGESFQDNMRYVKSYKEGFTERIAYHVYDVIECGVFQFRSPKRFIEGLKNVKEVFTSSVSSEEAVIEWHQKFIQEGYEGTMVRRSKEEYKKNGRSSDLLKYKDFQDIALKIIDIVSNESRPEQGTPVFELNGNQFKSGMKYSHAERIEFLENKNTYIGKTAEIRFFEYTDSGIPRFPVMVGIRLDK